MREIAITTPTINLDQLLKWSGLAATGGQARLLIDAGKVLLNGQVVRVRRRQVRPGDVVAVAGQGEYKIIAG